MLALENTIGGRVLAPDYMRAATALAHERGLGTHLDGARIANAAVKLGIGLAEAAAGFDSLSVCLSKGLGAPVGSVLCGSRPFIDAARRWRKMLGGGMRQAGVLAAAGLVALEQNISRLADDHANAARLAEGLAGLPGLAVSTPQTNIVYVDVPAEACAALFQACHDEGVLIAVGPHMRLVTHLDVSAQDIERVIQLFTRILAP